MAPPVPRIRVVSHPPLAPLRAWLPIPSSSATIRELLSSVQAMLGGVEGLGFELMGFALLPDSPCAMLDFENDILDVKAAATSSLAPPPTTRPSTIFTPTSPKKALNGLAVSNKPPPSSPSSSLSSVSSSDSDDSESDSGPEIESTTRPSSVHHLPTQPPPAKRIRLDGPAAAPLTSSSSDDESSSSSDSDSSSSSSEEEDEFEPIPIPPNEAQPPVPPGHGLSRTKKRNERRRTLSKFRAGASPQSVKPVKISNGVNGKQDKKLDMLHLANGNANKKKVIRVKGAKAPVRTTFDDAPTATTSTTEQKEGSPAYMPPSPSFSPGVWVPPPFSKQAKGRRQGFTVPSQRTDLPNHMVVTSVDVEKKNWVAGVGKVAQGTSRDFVEPMSDLEKTLAIVTGKGAGVSVAEAVIGVEQAVTMVGATVEDEEEASWEGWEEWKDWPSLDDVVARWDTLPVATPDARLGSRVATKILELDPSTYSPTVAIKFGSLLLPSPGSAHTLSLKLHPDCWPTGEDDWGEQEWEDAGFWESEWTVSEVRLLA